MFFYSLIIIGYTIISTFLLLFLLKKEQTKQEEEVLENWKKSLDIKELVTEETLLAEAEKKWSKDFYDLLECYFIACKNLKISPSADYQIIKKILQEYPLFLKSNLSFKIEFKENNLVYHFENKSKTRKVSLDITEDMLQNPPLCFLFEPIGNLYSFSGDRWDS